jgi:hypothetical protein
MPAEVVVAVTELKSGGFDTSRGLSASTPASEPNLAPGVCANKALQALTAAALAMPGLLLSTAPKAIEIEEAGIQYGHYVEGKRELYNRQSHLKPIEVDSLQTSAAATLADRVKFAFNYSQDTWSGATPVSTAPLGFGGNHLSTTSGASPYLSLGTVSLDAQHQPLVKDPASGKLVRDTQLVHTLSTASPETRKQGDFKLTYEWDEAAVDAGGGLSLENDYESGWGSLHGRKDFNQKLTSVDAGLSYTNSDTQALLDHDATPYIYETSAGLKTYNSTHSNSQLEVSGVTSDKILHGNREDWASQLGVTQIINKNAFVTTSVGFTRSTGYLDNPYKAVTTVFVDPKQIPSTAGVVSGTALSLLEQRPGERNQYTASLSYVQHIEPLNASLHFDYRLFRDDWGITSHTFQADWAQPLNDSWTITPRIRYYSQEAADFYQPYLVSNQVAPGKASIGPGGVITLSPLDPSKLPAHYSSDQRLSAYGALSGGVTISKRFAKGISLEASAEYYTHEGSLKMGGGGEGAYADFNYYMFNAALRVDLSAKALTAKEGHGEHAGHGMPNEHNHHSGHAPAGVMFDHMLSNAGEFMLGYRYMYSSENGHMLHGTGSSSDAAIVNQGCGGKPCYMTPDSMQMHMHMLDLMYAPTDWLNLMIMPQFVDMSMSMRPLDGAPKVSLTDPVTSAAVTHANHPHTTGGIGDTGLYALFKLYNSPLHHVHAALGLSAPSGDVGIQLRDTHAVSIGFIHYGMQLGSGTWDFKPSLTYTGQIDRWSWGAQISGTQRLQDRNSSGFAFGNGLQTTAWGSFSVLDWLSASVRGIYTVQGALKGAYNDTYAKIGPMDYGNNYGGHYWDIGFGLNAVVPTGDLQGNRFGVEWLQPVYDNPNGFQLPREGALSANWSYAF